MSQAYRLSVVVEKGPNEGAERDLTGTFTIGSDPASDLVLGGDDFVSALHARIVSSARETVLRNLSPNGTLLNGQSVIQAPLQPGDKVAIGTAHLLTVRGTRIAPRRDADARPASVPAAASIGKTSPSAEGVSSKVKVPTWLVVYLGLMALLFVFFMLQAQNRPPDLKQVQALEEEYAASHRLAKEGTARLVQLIETATVHERRGDRPSAYETYREALSVRQPVDPESPAFRYAASRIAALALPQ